MSDDFVTRANALLPHLGVTLAALAFIFLVGHCSGNDFPTRDAARACTVTCGSSDFVRRNDLCGCITWKTPAKDAVERP